jgi:nitrogen fixation/metabolism regulation signal transduction histidine kinase
MFKGKEIKKLVLVSTLCCVLLILSVSLYLMLSSRNNLSKQTEKMKMAMAEQIAAHLQGCYASMTEFLKSDVGVEFEKNLLDIGAGSQALYDFYDNSILGTFDADFVIYNTRAGRKISVAKPGLEVPDISADMTSGSDDYVILNELGGSKGTFFLFEKPGVFPGDKVVYAIDNSAQVDSIRQAYQDEKSRMMKQQIIVVTILFLLLLTLSLTVIHFSIKRLLGRPMSRLREEARDIIRGKSTAVEEVREGSIFANLQRLLNSGRILLGKGGAEKVPVSADESPVSNREVNMVILVWAVITTLLFLASTVIILVTSISMMNSKADTILTNVDREMADYYSSAYDSVTNYAKSNAGVYVGGDIWNPDSSVNRERSINSLTEMLRYAFNGDTAVSYVATPEGGKYFTSAKEGVELKEKPAHMGDPIAIYEGYYREGDLVIVNMNSTTYPGYTEQFAYYVIDITPQAQVLDQLYENGSSSLLKGQLLLSLIFLLLCLVLSPLAMAWATRKYITRPILELDAVSEKLIEGDLDVEITVDERSAFADIQRLLVQAQELLKTMAEME